MITLGIIGVVAAITIPALVSNYKKHVVETSLKKSFSMLNQLVHRSEVDNGSAAQWNWQITTDPDAADKLFDKYFLPYLKETSRYDNIGTNNAYKIYASDGEGPLWDNNNTTNASWHELPDGSAIRLSLWGREGVHFGTFTVVLPTGANKSYLIEGRDVFEFNIKLSADKSGVTIFPSTWANWTCKTVDDMRTTFISRCKGLDESNTSGNYPASYCAILIYCNGWKIPKDYPIKF